MKKAKMTDAKGYAVWTMAQRPFDVFLINTDHDGDKVNVYNPFRFPGQYSDPETNDMFWYNWNRYYAPELGRYNKAEIINIGSLQVPRHNSTGKKIAKYMLYNPELQNNYNYAVNNPISYVDPNARMAEVLVLAPIAPEIAIVGFGILAIGYAACVATGVCDVPDLPWEETAEDEPPDNVIKLFPEETEQQPEPQIPLIPLKECNDDDICKRMQEKCNMLEWQPPRNRNNFGMRMSCIDCYWECKHAGGIWPSYKCPIFNR